MNPLEIMSLIQAAVAVSGEIKALLDTGISRQSLAAAAPELIGHLESVGETLFPSLAPELRAVAAATATFDPNVTKWLQKSLNQYLGINLAVDGVYGQETKTAVEQVQAKLGIAVDGWAGQITQAALQLALSKL